MDALDRYIEERDEREPGFAEAVEAHLVEIKEFDDYMDAILERLAALGMNRRELAERAEMNASSLRRLLSDRDSNPTLDTMLRVAEALGLELSLRQSEEPNGRNPARV